ncbi:MAG: bifunctional DNA primase/polymerase, partial [Acidobacteria bacterium]|nr:bifunctional DNA primase/polymerase [Acidobacteriota bacterium]
MTALPDTPPASAHQAALDYAKRGWRVLAIKPGMKRPAMNAWQDAATTDPDTITSWWTGLYADHGVGICTGEASGLFIVDIDCAGGKTGYDSWRDLLDTYGDIPDGPTVITPSGGMHLYFRWPQGRSVGTNAARLGKHIDVRGEGGQCVAPPTVINGAAYTWEADTYDLEVPDAPEWLLELLTEPKRAPIADPPRTPINDTDGPIARYNASTTWEQLLTADGWTYVKTDRSGHSYWLRPELGHPHSAEWSASVGHAGVDLLHCFTSTVPWLEPERSYNRFQYYARRHHGGDEKSAARQILDDEGGRPTLTPFVPMIANPDDPWPAPIPLGSADAELPTFPLHTLPDWMAAQAKSVAAELQMPADLPAILGLTCLAAFAAKKTKVHVRTT